MKTPAFLADWQKQLLLSIFLALAFLSLNGRPDEAVIIVAVVLLHEAGHMAAMKWYGYSDTKIFILPFGGLASGVPDETRRSATSDVVIAAAGPIPGIALAAAAVHFLPWEYWDESVEFGVWCLGFINAVNLFPVGVLDGGKILRKVLSPLHPLAASVVEVAATALLAALALLWGSTLFLLLCAASLAGSAPVLLEALEERKMSKRKREWLARVGSTTTGPPTPRRVRAAAVAVLAIQALLIPVGCMYGSPELRYQFLDVAEATVSAVTGPPRPPENYSFTTPSSPSARSR